jgi:hypothetical protein
MNKNEFIRLINHIKPLDSEALSEIKSLMRLYPYFQAAYVLNAKTTPTSDNITKAAVRTLDRSILQKIISTDYNPYTNQFDIQEHTLQTDGINAFDTLKEAYIKEDDVRQYDAIVDFKDLDSYKKLEEFETSLTAPPEELEKEVSEDEITNLEAVATHTSTEEIVSTPTEEETTADLTDQQPVSFFEQIESSKSEDLQIADEIVKPIHLHTSEETNNVIQENTQNSEENGSFFDSLEANTSITTTVTNEEKVEEEKASTGNFFDDLDNTTANNVVTEVKEPTIFDSVHPEVTHILTEDTHEDEHHQLDEMSYIFDEEHDRTDFHHIDFDIDELHLNVNLHEEDEQIEKVQTNLQDLLAEAKTVVTQEEKDELLAKHKEHQEHIHEDTQLTYSYVHDEEYDRTDFHHFEDETHTQELHLTVDTHEETADVYEEMPFHAELDDFDRTEFHQYAKDIEEDYTFEIDVLEEKLNEFYDYDNLYDGGDDTEIATTTTTTPISATNSATETTSEGNFFDNLSEENTTAITENTVNEVVEKENSQEGNFFDSLAEEKNTNAVAETTTQEVPETTQGQERNFFDGLPTENTQTVVSQVIETQTVMPTQEGSFFDNLTTDDQDIIEKPISLQPISQNTENEDVLVEKQDNLVFDNPDDFFADELEALAEEQKDFNFFESLEKMEKLDEAYQKFDEDDFGSDMFGYEKQRWLTEQYENMKREEQNLFESGDEFVKEFWNYKKSVEEQKAYYEQRKTEQNNLIDKFIAENPQIQIDRNKLSDEQQDLSAATTKEHRFAVSEQLALIYAQQGKIQKAIIVYRKLALKYPEKSAYFTAQIEELKK